MFITRPKWHPPKTFFAILTISSAHVHHQAVPQREGKRGYVKEASGEGSLFRLKRLRGRNDDASRSEDFERGIRGAKSPGINLGRAASGRRAPTGNSLFGRLEKAFADLEIQMRKTRPYDGFDMPAEEFWRLFHTYEDDLKHVTQRALRSPSRQLDSDHETTLTQILNSGWVPDRLSKIIKIGFYNQVMGAMFTSTELDRQRTMTDCRYPMEWFPNARLVKRTLHLHVGPTNSGKTYQALKRLESAKVGCYAGPLRLLAQEIYARMNARGKPTWLITGDDQQTPNIPHNVDTDESITSCTVEMIDFQRAYDVAVIDEVQMAADTSRGHAWTAAIVGVPAKEVHMCGEERTVPLIQEIARSLGEELIIHRYQRLSPLAVMDKPLGAMSNLEKGDCIVCFSVMRIHAMKRYVEKMTGKRVAIIYGSLPPEVRAQQARLFNDLDNDFDYLVASDAIGMGLNLAISRVIFDTVRKRTKAGQVELTTPEIRQIGGRAGRYKTASQDGKVTPPTPNVTEDTLKVSVDSDEHLYPATKAPPPANTEQKLGLVTSFERSDLNAIRRSMNTDPQPIRKFGVLPTNDMIELFCSYFPVGIPYSFILARILEISQVSSRYFFCDMQDTIDIADIIQPVANLSIAERIKVCFAPVSVSIPGNPELIRELAEAVANQSGGDLLDIKNINFDCLDEEIQPNREYLSKLEILHKGLVLYLWMSFRFPGVFIQRPLAIKAKMLVEDNIDKCLNSMKYANIDQTRLREKIPVAMGHIDPDKVAADLDEGGLEGEEHTPRDDAEEYPQLDEEVAADAEVPSSSVEVFGVENDTNTRTDDTEHKVLKSDPDAIFPNAVAIEERGTSHNHMH